MKFIPLALIVSLLCSCAIFKSKPSSEILNIGSSMSTVEGLRCYQVFTDSDNADNGLLCTEIEGFEYEPGFNYQLEVSKTKLSKDSAVIMNSLYKYNLVSVLSKTMEITEDGLYAKMATSMGDIYIKLEMEKAPLTVANFVGLAEGKIANKSKSPGVPFYDSTVFHRVIPRFMIQGGDPLGTGVGGPGYSFRDEFEPSLTHDKPGILSMANSGKNTNGSQFFITHNATQWLNGKHSIFGHVIAGQQIVVDMANVPKNRRNKPDTPIYLTKLTIIRVGEAAESFDAAATFEKLK